MIFILFSSYHFGEQHWSDDVKQNIMGLFFYLSYGALVFFLIFSTQHLEVSQVMQKISGKDDFLHFFNLPQSLDGFINSYLAFEFFIGITIALLVLFILNLIYNGLISKYLFRELILLLFLFILFYLSTLLFAFAFYFVVWHSIPSLKDQLNYLHGEINLKSIEDSFASAANYISSIGWKNENPCFIKVNLNQNVPIKYLNTSAKKISFKKKFKFFKKYIDNPETINIDENLYAAIVTPDKDIVPDSEILKPAFIVFNNYELILKWNRSLRFALAVCTLKDEFKNAL